jgi:glycine cleavage system protein P-like pyridoxal-binding family
MASTPLIPKTIEADDEVSQGQSTRSQVLVPGTAAGGALASAEEGGIASRVVEMG